MRRSTRFPVMAVFATVAAMAFAACNNTTPTTPTGTTTTETFTGTLTANGAKVFTFAVQTSGTAVAALTTISPDATAQLGLALGTWNGSSCAITIAHDTATQGSTVTGTVSGAGTLCVRVYDSTGSLPGSEDFTVTVSHP